jgi:hypothetical protein
VRLYRIQRRTVVSGVEQHSTDWICSFDNKAIEAYVAMIEELFSTQCKEKNVTFEQETCFNAGWDLTEIQDEVLNDTIRPQLV